MKNKNRNLNESIDEMLESVKATAKNKAKEFLCHTPRYLLHEECRGSGFPLGKKMSCFGSIT